MVVNSLSVVRAKTICGTPNSNTTPLAYVCLVLKSAPSGWTPEKPPVFGGFSRKFCCDLSPEFSTCES